MKLLICSAKTKETMKSTTIKQQMLELFDKMMGDCLTIVIPTTTDIRVIKELLQAEKREASHIKSMEYKIQMYSVINKAQLLLRENDIEERGLVILSGIIDGKLLHIAYTPEQTIHSLIFMFGNRFFN